MSKQLTYILLVALGFGLLAGAIGWYINQAAQLREYRLDGVFLLLLIFFAIAMLVMPVQLRLRWHEQTPLGLLREWLVRSGWVIGGGGGAMLGLLAIVYLIVWPVQTGRPYLLFPWLALLVPTVATAIDMFNGTYPRSLHNFRVGFLTYSVRIYGLLAVQFTVIPIGFVLFPAGLFLQFIGIFDLVMRWRGHYSSDLPMLCDWVNLSSTVCGPALAGFHLGHIVLAALAMAYGEAIFNWLGDRYRNAVRWSAAKIRM